MFRRGSFILRFMAALLLIAILAGGGYAVYRLGFTQGYAVGIAQTAGDSQQFRQGFPYYPGFMMPHFGFGFFPIFPLFGFLFFGFFILMLVGFIFRPRHWGPAGMQHMHDHPWGPPPWAKEQPGAEPSSSETEKP
jgi:hypothetical protein